MDTINLSLIPQTEQKQVLIEQLAQLDPNEFLYVQSEGQFDSVLNELKENQFPELDWESFTHPSSGYVTQIRVGSDEPCCGCCKK